MKELTDPRIKRLFDGVSAAMAVFAAASAICAASGTRYAALYVLLLAACMTGLVIALMTRYVREENQIFENAAAQIRTYIAGDRSARIDCEEEGGLNRLFHEINSLAAVLNAHAENEGRTKAFLKDTISDISHQLKMPLAALTIYNGLLQEETSELPAAREFVTLSEQELDRLQTLVQSLLKIAKLDAGTIVPEKAGQNVSEMMEYIERHFAQQAEREHKTLLLSGNEDAVLCCDRHWMTEAVSNIVKNAFDHTQPGGTICVAWRCFASIVQITVKDDGSGIHPEDLPHIFKRFYRSRFSRDQQGVGLGLPLAKAIIEAHGGSVEVDSVQGVGTTFTINFPIPTKL